MHSPCYYFSVVMTREGGGGGGERGMINDTRKNMGWGGWGRLGRRRSSMPTTMTWDGTADVSDLIKEDDKV